MVLRRQWRNVARRESRLLGDQDAWPIVLSIGVPSPRKLRSDLDAVKRHLEAWRTVSIGEVVWEEIRYRATATSVSIPVQWIVRRPTEWIDAANSEMVRQEFESLSLLVEQTDTTFHSLWVRRRSLWLGKPIQEVIQAARLAMVLEPGCANGQPLRMLSMERTDTKFFERNGALVTTLLDARFDGEVGRLGLENFLDAYREGDHWILVIDLDGKLLPFKKQRVRSSELRDTALQCAGLLIVENETCEHQLPSIPETVAVLGAGFDLVWAEAEWLKTKRVAYWGDIDTWGLQFLAKARTAMPYVEALMMNILTYERFADSAIAEPVVAGTELPLGLTATERQLYRHLLQQSRGRLEQEYLATQFVHEQIETWYRSQFQF